MQVQSIQNINSVRGQNYNPAFGGTPTTSSVEKIVKDIHKAKSSVIAKWFEKRAGGLGEKLNNYITAIGTAAVAPIFIVNNPFSTRDKETKKYSAWRQPISAAIALAVLNPIDSAWNKIIDGMVYNNKIKGYDLSAKPPEHAFRNFLDVKYKHSKTEAQKLIAIKEEELGRKLNKEELKELWPYQSKWGFKNKEAYRKAEMKKIHETAFRKVIEVQRKQNIYLCEDINISDAQLARLRANKHNIDGKAYENVITYKDLVTPEHYEKAYKELKVNDRNKLMTKAAEFAKAEYNVELQRKEWTTKAYEEMLAIFTDKEIKERRNLNEAKAAELNLKKPPGSRKKYTHFNLPEEHKIRMLDTLRIKELKNEAFEDVLKIWQDLSAKKSGEANAIEHKVYDKLAKIKENNPNKCYMDFIFSHGDDMFAIKNSVIAKRWVSARTLMAEAKFKNSKQITGAIIGIALASCIACTILNWAHPRIMSKFFPRLANSKAEKQQRKEGE